jgi:type VI secretion system secreted protein Hcp
MLKKQIFQIGIPTIFVGIILISLVTFVGTSNTAEMEGTNEMNSLNIPPVSGMYLTLTGENQGEIKGGVVVQGKENSILVLASTHSIISPRDAASGLPTGKRQHKPITITKLVDKASPLLAECITKNENILTWKLDFWRLSKAGAEQLYFTIELENAAVAGISQQATADGFTERVSFTYQKIIWTWVDGGITAQDDWEAPVV